MSNGDCCDVTSDPVHYHNVLNTSVRLQANAEMIPKLLLGAFHAALLIEIYLN